MTEDLSQLPPPPPPIEAVPEREPAHGNEQDPKNSGRVVIGRGRVNETLRQDGFIYLTVQEYYDTPAELRSWDYAEVWVKPVKKPDPRIIYEQYRQDPKTGIVWQVVGRNTDWACVEGPDTTRPEVFPVSIVETWEVVKGR